MSGIDESILDGISLEEIAAERAAYVKKEPAAEKVVPRYGRGSRKKRLTKPAVRAAVKGLKAARADAKRQAWGLKEQVLGNDLVIERSMTEEDVERLRLIDEGVIPRDAPVRKLQRLSHGHHRLAQMLALKRPVHEISALTGYSIFWIAALKKDEMFKKLLMAYEGDREGVFVDVMERVRMLGLTMLDELQYRFEKDPDSWTNRQLLDALELLLIKSGLAVKAQGSLGALGGGSNVSVNVKFVTAEKAGGPSTLDAIDVESVDLVG